MDFIQIFGLDGLSNFWAKSNNVHRHRHVLRWKDDGGDGVLRLLDVKVEGQRSKGKAVRTWKREV